LTAYVNAAGSSDLTAGKYAAAVVQIKPRKRACAYRSAMIDTNLCVAYIAMRDLPAARTACDAAVTAEQAEHVGLSV
jgi:Flp pilus assembly protein TadD